MDGKKTDVIVTLLPREDKLYMSSFGEPVDKTWDFDRLKVWADAGLLQTFEKTNGVMGVKLDPNVSILYIILVDPRYDTEWVMEEIKAVAQIHKPETRKAMYPWEAKMPEDSTWSSYYQKGLSDDT